MARGPVSKTLLSPGDTCELALGQGADPLVVLTEAGFFSSAVLAVDVVALGDTTGTWVPPAAPVRSVDGGANVVSGLTGVLNGLGFGSGNVYRADGAYNAIRWRLVSILSGAVTVSIWTAPTPNSVPLYLAQGTTVPLDADGNVPVALASGGTAPGTPGSPISVTLDEAAAAGATLDDLLEEQRATNELLRQLIGIYDHLPVA